MESSKVAVSVMISVVVLLGVFQLGFCSEDPLIMMKLGGIRDFRGSHYSAEIETLARFAVEEHNKKENALLEFKRVLKAKEQVVTGKLFHLTLEAIDGGKKKVYEAKVWVKSWMNFKELQEFKRAHDVSPFTAADLGVKPDDHGPEWQEVPPHDLEVRDAANHAVKSIQQRSNSLSPYTLLEILLAPAKVIENSAAFDLLLKVTRGITVEKFRVKVSKDSSGKFYLSQIEQDPS